MVSETLTTFVLTIFGGVSIYVLGQIFLKFFIEPVHELLQIIGKIGDILIFYANVYTNTVIDAEKNREANDKLRKHASLLKSKSHLVKWHGLFSCLGFIPSKENIHEAHINLIGISNTTPNSSSQCVQNMRKRQLIESLLRLSNKPVSSVDPIDE